MIVESKSEAQGIKSYVHKIIVIILLDKSGIWTINNENLSLLSKGLHTKTESSTLMSRSKNETCFPRHSTLRSNSNIFEIC